MKKFLSTFAICLILCGAFTFFFAGFLFSNIWVLTVFVALVLTALICVFSHYEERVATLEKTVERLEEQSPPRESD